MQKTFTLQVKAKNAIEASTAEVALQKAINQLGAEKVLAFWREYQNAAFVDKTFINKELGLIGLNLSKETPHNITITIPATTDSQACAAQVVLKEIAAQLPARCIKNIPVLLNKHADKLKLVA